MGFVFIKFNFEGETTSLSTSIQCVIFMFAVDTNQNERTLTSLLIYTRHGFSFHLVQSLLNYCRSNFTTSANWKLRPLARYYNIQVYFALNYANESFQLFHVVDVNTVTTHKGSIHETDKTWLWSIDGKSTMASY